MEECIIFHGGLQLYLFDLCQWLVRRAEIFPTSGAIVRGLFIRRLLDKNIQRCPWTLATVTKQQYERLWIRLVT